MAKLPKSIIKKHGITKKAWRIFRAKKGTTKKVKTKTTRRVKTMVKRKVRKSRKSGMNAQTKRIIGAAAYATIGEPIFDMAASKVGIGIADDYVKAIGGYFLAKNTSGILKGVGEAAMIISVSNVAKAQVGNLLTRFSGNNEAVTPAAQSEF